MTIESTWADWLASTKPDAKPLKLLLSRKIRPHGSLRELVRLRKVFALSDVPPNAARLRPSG